VNATTFAVKLGVARGWREFKLIFTHRQDVAFYVIFTGVVLGILLPRRGETFEGTQLSIATLSMPGVLGGLVAFLTTMGVATSIATEREDGTLLRAKALPNGMVGYFSGQVVRSFLETVLGLVLVLVPSLFLIEGVLGGGAGGLFTMLWVLVLGVLATLPLGAMLGAVVGNPRSLGMIGTIPISGLVAISGIFYPISALPGWLQGVAQGFPMYWMGLGMRSAFLPDEAVAIEIGQSWRHLETAGALGAWAIAGALVAPLVLRRMARRESGSSVEVRRQKALQRLA
jgi:ABC-2 type transport system permease protein